MVSLRSRRGVSTLGCLFSLLVAAIVLYYALDIGRVYWKFYKLKDEMTTSARFAQNNTDEDIQRQLSAVARDLELPAEAQRFVIRRSKEPPLVNIKTEYRVTIELPFHNRILVLKPNVTVRQ